MLVGERAADDEPPSAMRTDTTIRAGPSQTAVRRDPRDASRLASAASTEEAYGTFTALAEDLW